MRRVMRKLVTLVLAAGLLSLSAGCASKATDEECQAACQNVAAVALAGVEEKIKQDDELQQAGEQGQELVRKQAQIMLETIRSQCEDQCKQRGTQEQALCLQSATTLEALQACK